MQFNFNHSYTFEYKRACELNKSHIISTDEDQGLRIESFAVINFTWCFHKQYAIKISNTFEHSAAIIFNSLPN